METPAKKEEADMKKRVDALHRSYDAVKTWASKVLTLVLQKRLELFLNPLLHSQDLQVE